MNILLVNKYWRRVGGVEEYSFMLERTFTELGHRVIVVSQAEEETLPSPWAQYFVPPVYPASESRWEQGKAAARAVTGRATRQAVERLLSDIRVDAVHVVHVYHQLGPQFLRLLADRNIPVVLSLHDYKLCCPSYRLYDDHTSQICTKCLDKPSRSIVNPVLTACWHDSRMGGAMLGAEALSVRLLRPYVRAAGRVLVSNDLMRRCAIAGGIPDHRIRVVPNYWPTSGAVPPRTPSRHALFVGRLVAEKGVDVLVRASAESGVPVRIVGDGVLLDSLKELASLLHAPVTFVGAVWGADLEQEMLRSAMIVIPSVWHEVSPLVAYQAMSLGTPIIASDVGGMPDLLGDGRGFLVPPRDVASLARTMHDVLEDGSSAEVMASSALAFSQTELSSARFTERLVGVFGEIGVRL